ncbi:MAG TPA: 3-oxoacyl-[acyl-carrier-protein] synthase III C-terminal domain-containing protein [Jatrophihabitans sp.]|nr:3-oxoacyl-[acyl-carrier-protein] synthase III C-terminal domain-containing protein [Jatrophihabitans sp.]
MTALAAVAAYLPETRVPIGELTEQLQLRERDMQLFQRFYGLSEVCRDPDGTLTDLLLAATGKLTELAGLEHRIRYVIYAGGSRATVPYPINPLHDVCAELGLTEAIAFSVTDHACASTLLAIDLAGRLLAADGDPESLALIVAGMKTFSQDTRLVPETSLFSEGSAACLVSATGSSDRVLSYATSMRGDFDGWITDEVEAAARYGQAYGECLADVLRQAVDQAGLSMADLALILPHNVNSVSWRRLCKRMDFPRQRVLLDNVGVFGHCFAADGLINYRTAQERGLLQPGDYYLMAAAGQGAVFSAMVFQH